MQKRILFLFLLFFFSCFRVAFALQITEIMYDTEGSDKGVEWIEIYNDTDHDLDISNLKFFEGNTNHKLIYVSGQKTLIPQGFFLIVSDPVAFKNLWKNYSGTIFDSSFSLSNSGEFLAIKNKNLEILDEYFYNVNLGAQGDGKSLQKFDDGWKASLPTPGAKNIKINSSTKKSSTEQNEEKFLDKNREKENFETRNLVANSGGVKNISDLENFSKKSSKSDRSGAKFYLIIATLFLVIVFAVIGVTFLRKKTKKVSIGDDFEILQ